MSKYSARGKEWDAKRAVVLERDNYRCMNIGCNNEATEVDHVYPRSKALQEGWTPAEADDLSNLVAMCQGCNRSKQDKATTRIEFEDSKWFKVK